MTIVTGIQSITFVVCLHRLRESQQMALTERQSNSAGIINDQQPNEMDGPQMNRNEEDENSLKGKYLIHT